MNFTWPGAATFAVVVLAWAGIWFLRKREVNFSLIALAALGIGIPIGLVAKEHVDAIAPIGKIYINVLLAVVAPLIFVAIVASITSLGTLAKLKSIGLRSIFWLLVSNALGVLLAVGLGLTFQPGSGVHNELGTAASQTIEGQVQAFSQVVVGLFPTNVVENFSSNDIIPIILVALTLSVAYLAIAETGAARVKPFADGAESLKLVIFKAVGYVIRLTPYAIVALTAHIVGTSANLGDNFWSLIGLLGLVWGACFVHAFAINSVLLHSFANVPVLEFFKKIFPAQLTAFTTQSSVGTLPVTTTQLTQKVGVHSEIAHFTAPLGTTIGMPGCAGIWPVLIAIWGINAYDIPYTAQDYILLAFLAIFVSVGTAGVPGAATVAAATVLAAAGLPLEFVAVTIPISIIADTARTMNNVTAAAVSATIVARQTGMLDDDVFAGRKEPDEPSGSGAAEAPVPALPAGPAQAPAQTVPAIAAQPVPAAAAASPLWNGTPQPAAPVPVAAAPVAAAPAAAIPGATVGYVVLNGVPQAVLIPTPQAPAPATNGAPIAPRFAPDPAPAVPVQPSVSWPGTPAHNGAAPADRVQPEPTPV